MYFIVHKAYLLIGFSFCCLLGNAQNQAIADSLAIIYQEDTSKGFQKLELLEQLAFNEVSDYQLSLKYSEELIALAKAEKNNLFLHHGYMRKGRNYLLLGNTKEAIEAFFKSASASVNAKDIKGEAGAYITIADTYLEIGNSENAYKYYQQSIQILRATKDSLLLASALLNLGDEYLKNQQFNLALQNFEESSKIFEAQNYEIGIAYNLGNTGMVYAGLGKNDLAEENINEAISILEKLGDYYPIPTYLNSMSDIYIDKNDFNSGLKYAKRSLHLSKSIS